MIIPTYRLVFWTGLVLIPFGTLITVNLWISGLCILIFIVSVMFDALMARRLIRDVRIELPNIIRASRGQETCIKISLTCNHRINCIRVGFQFPESIRVAQFSQTYSLSGENSLHSVEFPFKGSIQGKYLLKTCYFEIYSPLKLWSKRNNQTIHTEIRIYPDLYSERRHLSALFLHRQLGIHTRRHIGKGRDFEQLRDYFPGDSFDDIHWKATAKQRRPITKIYQIERSQIVYVIIDTSRLSARIPVTSDIAPATTLLDRFVTAALSVGLAADRQGDRFGLLAFGDKINRYVKAGTGKKHYNACRDALFTLQAQQVSPDYSELFTCIRTRIRKRALMVILTSLDDPLLAESFIHNVHLIRKQHLIMVNMIKPKSAEPLFTSPDVQASDDLYRYLGGHLLLNSLIQTRKILERSGIQFHLIDNEYLCPSLISQYIDVKQRQVL